MRKIAALTVLFWLTGQTFAQTFTNYTSADGLLSDNVNCVDTDASDVVWFGTQNGVSVFDGTVWTDHTVTSDPGFIDNNIQAIHCAANGDVWVGTDFGVSVYSGGGWTSYTSADGMANEQIKCITENASGEIWFGTNSGASLFNGTSWTNIGTAQGLPFGGVTEIDVHANGDVWFGTGLSGVRLYNSVIINSITDADGLIDNRIRAMVFDQTGKKWIGTSEGITILDNTNAFSENYTTIFTLPPPDTLNPIEDIEMDSQGNMWVGVYVDYLVTEGGVCAYNGNQWLQYEVSDGLVGPVVRALAIDDNDDVWVATSTGATKISDNSLALNAPELEEFGLYPNPTNGLVTIQLHNSDVSNTVLIYNAAMQLVSTEFISKTELTLSTDNLSSGVYLVQIGNSTRKLVVKK